MLNIKFLIKIKKIILVFFLLIGVGILFLLITKNNNTKAENMILENFRHISNNGEVEIDISDGIYSVILLSLENQPKNLDNVIHNAMNNVSKESLYTDNKGIIKINLKEDFYNNVNVLFFKDSKSKKRIGYIELLRQSAKDLKQYYNFEKKDGYTILGRTNIILPEGKKFINSNIPIIIPSRRPYPVSIKEFYPHERYEPEITEAIAAIRYLWSEPINIGPTNQILDSSYGVLRRLEMLRQGEWSTQCSDFRTLFNNLVLHSNIIRKVRRVELRQHFPTFTDLIVNSHSISEIYVEGLHKWIAVDPWFGYLFTVDGKYVNTQEIASMKSEKYSKIKIEKWVPDRKISTQLPEENEFIIISNGYFGYFGSIEYGPTRYQ